MDRKEQKSGDMVRVSGLWAAKTKDGSTYLSGQISPCCRILVFMNKNRKNKNDSAAVVYIAPVQRRSVSTGDDEPNDDMVFENEEETYNQYEDTEW